MMLISVVHVIIKAAVFSTTSGIASRQWCCWYWRSVHHGVEGLYTVVLKVYTPWCWRSIHRGVEGLYTMVLKVYTPWCWRSVHHGCGS